MTEPIHHVPDAMLAAYAADSLPYPYAVLVAAHVSLCDDCRAHLDAHNLMGGLLLDDLEPSPLSVRALERSWGRAEVAPARPEPDAAPSGFPAPIASIVGRRGPRWRSLGFGAPQAIVWTGASGTLRLVSVPAGQAVPEHGHAGLELTLVLSGAFTDETGRYGAGDLEVADENLGHVPRATDEGPCLCVAATDAPLRFRALIPRLLQPIFRI